MYTSYIIHPIQNPIQRLAETGPPVGSQCSPRWPASAARVARCGAALEPAKTAELDTEELVLRYIYVCIMIANMCIYIYIYTYCISIVIC